MTVLSPPRHHLIETALHDATTWCTGHIIDDRPALAHATVVAATLGAHIPDATPELVAAALLHDSPEFAPRHIDLDILLTYRYGAEVRRLVRALEAEHTALDSGAPLLIDDLPVLLISTADKIVALSSLLRRAARSGDSTAFFRQRQPLLTLLPHFTAWQIHAIGRVPATMTDRLALVLNHLDAATALTRAAASPAVTG